MKTKNLILFFALIVFGSNLIAQTEKGKWLVGATTSNFSAGFSKNSSRLSFQLSPTVGYFVADNLVVGARVGVAHAFSNAVSISKSRNSSLYGGLFARYYVPLTKRFKIPFEAELGSTYFTQNSDGSKSHGNSYNGAVSGGIAFFLNENVSLDFLAGYRFTEYGGQLSFLHRGSIGGQLGFSLYLDCKQKNN